MTQLRHRPDRTPSLSLTAGIAGGRVSEAARADRLGQGRVSDGRYRLNWTTGYAGANADFSPRQLIDQRQLSPFFLQPSRRWRPSRLRPYGQRVRPFSIARAKPFLIAFPGLPSRTRQRLVGLLVYRPWLPFPKLLAMGAEAKSDLHASSYLLRLPGRCRYAS